MNKLYSFISSDYRDFYKADVYKTLCLPDEAIVHFRYKKRHISDEVLSNLAESECKKCLITFRVCKNALKQNNTNPENLDYSIRFGRICKVKVEDDTGVVHFFLSLRDFNAPKIKNNSLPDELKHVDLVTPEIVFESSTPQNWSDVASAIFDHFPINIFVRLKAIRCASNKLEIKPKIGWDRTYFYYELIKQKKYIIELSSFNVSGDKAQFSLHANSESIVLQKVDNHVSDLTHDNYYIASEVPLSDPVISPDGLELSIPQPDKGKEVEDTQLPESNNELSEHFGFNIPLLVKNDICKSITGAAFSTLALIGLILMAPLRTLTGSKEPDLTSIILGSVLFCISSAVLLQTHRKSK